MCSFDFNQLFDAIKRFMIDSWAGVETAGGCAPPDALKLLKVC